MGRVLYGLVSGLAGMLVFGGTVGLLATPAIGLAVAYLVGPFQALYGGIRYREPSSRGWTLRPRFGRLTVTVFIGGYVLPLVLMFGAAAGVRYSLVLAGAIVVGEIFLVNAKRRVPRVARAVVSLMYRRIA